MTALTVFDFNSKGIRFEKRNERIWVNLTDMAQASGKKVHDYTRLKSTTEFIAELEAVTGISATETQQGGQPITQGTWGVEEVAIDFAAWCNTSFRVWVSQQIRTLMSEGTVTLAAPIRKPAELVVDLVASLEKLGIEMDNPRYKQALQDVTLNILGVSEGQRYLKSEIWVGVVERAEQLDYPVALIANKRSQLGKFVKSFGLESKQEHRLVNGTQRPVWVYRQCGQLDGAIHQFFNPDL